MAELPSLTIKEWLGRFAVSANNKYEFWIESAGAIKLIPEAKRTQKFLAISISPNVVETMPDGTQVTRQITSLESSDPATDELKKTTIRGKVTGDTAFEITIEDRQGTIYMGGKITQPGPAVKNPQRFTITTTFPNLYISQSQNLDTEKQRENFQKIVEKDKITIKRVDGKRVKQTFEENVDGSSEDITGPGITSTETQCQGFFGRKITLTAAPNSSMKLTNPNNEPLWNGYTLTWSADPEKDKDNKAQLAIEVR